MKYPLYLMTGAPGAGKSTTLNAFLHLQTEYLAFDIDWLAEAASKLAGKNIYSDSSSWTPYGVLWFDVLHAIYKNGKTPVFFSPNDPQDLAQFGQPSWCSSVNWLLLDCDDPTRRNRLEKRPNWPQAMVDEAVIDARVLRQTIPLIVDTGSVSPDEAAAKILAWLLE